MLYQMPALAGYGGWWELHESEAQALAEPTARLLRRMSPKAQETFSRFFDPIALVFTAVVITVPRIQQTQGAIMAARLKMETQGRLSRGLSQPTQRGNGSTAQQDVVRNPGSAVDSDRTPGSDRSNQPVKDAFD